MELIRLFVHGKPRTAGSKTGYLNKKSGKFNFTPAGKYQKPWMESVKWAAIQAGYNGKLIIEGPISLTICFAFLRPKGHYKKSGELTKNARLFPTVKPDMGKLTRAVEDALTGLVWRDDCQVCDHIIKKRYKQPEGCEIIIQEIKK